MKNNQCKQKMSAYITITTYSQNVALQFRMTVYNLNKHNAKGLYSHKHIENVQTDFNVTKIN